MSGRNQKFRLTVSSKEKVWQRNVPEENSRTLVLLGAAQTSRQRRASVPDVRGKSWNFVPTAGIGSNDHALAHVPDAALLLQQQAHVPHHRADFHASARYAEPH